MENLLVKLKTFGDSHTKGSMLKDPNSTWPVLLGNKLNLPVENYGVKIGSNEEIIHLALSNSPATEKSLIIIMTTFPDRVYWNNTSIESSDTDEIYQQWLNNKFDIKSASAYQKIQIDRCKELLEYRGHEVYVFHIVEQLYEIKSQLDKCYKTYYNICRTVQPNPSGHGYYDEEAVAEWANYLYNLITGVK